MLNLYGMTPQDLLRNIGFGRDLLTPQQWVGVVGVQITKETPETAVAHVRIDEPKWGIILYVFWLDSSGWRRMTNYATYQLSKGQGETGGVGPAEDGTVLQDQ